MSVLAMCKISRIIAWVVVPTQVIAAIRISGGVMPIGMKGGLTTDILVLSTEQGVILLTLIKVAGLQLATL